MVIPLVILAVLSICTGWFNIGGGFSEFMGHSNGHGEAAGFVESFFGIVTHPLPLTALLVALAGIGLAYLMYGAKKVSAEAIGRAFKPFYILFSRKYWFDELYEKVIVGNVLYKGLFKLFANFDSNVVDGSVNGLANGTMAAGRSLRKIQNGQLQVYIATMVIGIAAIVICIFIFGRG